MNATPEIATPKFNGFGKQTLKFLNALAKNNNRQWFEAHRADYEQHYVQPAQALVMELGPRLEKLSPGINYDPNHTGRGSIKKIFTDQRYRDRKPYKTWLDVIFWEGPLKAKKDNSVLGVRLTPDGLWFFSGIKHFDNKVLKAYRAAVDDAKSGAALTRAIGKVAKRGPYKFPEPEYKQVPRGFDAGHARADLLRNNAMFAFSCEKHPKELGSAKLLDYAYARLKDMAPVHKWCVRILAGL
jgi:uncharacterized protein (TIGR02453 family)